MLAWRQSGAGVRKCLAFLLAAIVIVPYASLSRPQNPSRYCKKKKQSAEQAAAVSVDVNHFGWELLWEEKTIFAGFLQMGGSGLSPVFNQTH